LPLYRWLVLKHEGPPAGAIDSESEVKIARKS